MYSFILNLIKKTPIKVILISFTFIFLILIGVKNINLKTGTDTLIQTDTKEYQDYFALEKEFGGDPIIVLVEDNNLNSLLSINNVQMLYQLENYLKNNEDVLSINSPASLIHQLSIKQVEQFKIGMIEMVARLETLSTNLENISTTGNISVESAPLSTELNTIISELQLLSSSIETIDSNHASEFTQITNKLIMINNQFDDFNTQSNSTLSFSENIRLISQNLKAMSQSLKMMINLFDLTTVNIPHKQPILDQMLYDEQGALRSIFNEFIIKEQYMILMITLKGNISDAEKSELVVSINDYIEQQSNNSKVIVTGKPVLDLSIKSSMKSSMQQMMLLAVFMMIIVLTLTFKVRWRLLPLLTILVAVITTIGIMGWLNIPITMVSMAVFPILIGLGIDYAIQFQSRYSEELMEVLYEE